MNPRPFSDMDDSPEEYPEMWDELFEDFYSAGLRPEELTEPVRSQYTSWIKQRKDE